MSTKQKSVLSFFADMVTPPEEELTTTKKTKASFYRQYMKSYLLSGFIATADSALLLRYV